MSYPSYNLSILRIYIWQKTHISYASFALCRVNDGGWIINTFIVWHLVYLFCGLFLLHSIKNLHRNGKRNVTRPLIGSGWQTEVNFVWKTSNNISWKARVIYCTCAFQQSLKHLWYMQLSARVLVRLTIYQDDINSKQLISKFENTIQ